MLKKIVLHSSAVDSLDRFADAGSELDVIADDAPATADAIHLSKANALIDQQRAVSKTQAEELEKQPPTPEDAAVSDAVSAEPPAASGKRGK